MKTPKVGFVVMQNHWFLKEQFFSFKEHFDYLKNSFQYKEPFVQWEDSVKVLHETSKEQFTIFFVLHFTYSQSELPQIKVHVLTEGYKNLHLIHVIRAEVLEKLDLLWQQAS